MKNQKSKTKNQKSDGGQALITLLFFMVIGITVITAATIVLFINVLSANTTQQGTMAYYTAESGLEDGILKTLRNPSYVGTYNPISGNSQLTVVVTNTSITSTATINSSVRKVTAQKTYNSGVLTISSWKETN